MEKLNKNEIIDLVAARTHISKIDAKAAVDEAFEIIQEALLDGQSVSVKNFCVFEVKQKAERKGTNPRDHSEIVIKSQKTVTIHVSREFKDKLNK